MQPTHLLKMNVLTIKLVIFLIAGNRDQALWTLEQGLAYWERRPKEDSDKIKIRMKKYFGK